MKYFLIEMIDPNNPIILNETEGSNKPLILMGNKNELEKMALENAQKGMLVPITFNILNLMSDIYNFIGRLKFNIDEIIDVGESGIVNSDDSLEAKVGEYIINIKK